MLIKMKVAISRQFSGGNQFFFELKRSKKTNRKWKKSAETFKFYSGLWVTQQIFGPLADWPTIFLSLIR
jgi:hypothetical protein